MLQPTQNTTKLTSDVSQLAENSFHPFYLYLSFLHHLSLSFSLCHEGLQDSTPTTQGVTGRPAGDGYQLLVAVVGSVTVTCVTILLALLALFFIRKTLLNRRRTFTYQSGSVRSHKHCFFFNHRAWADITDDEKNKKKPPLTLEGYFNSVLLLSFTLFIPSGRGDHSAV